MEQEPDQVGAESNVLNELYALRGKRNRDDIESAAGTLLSKHFSCAAGNLVYYRGSEKPEDRPIKLPWTWVGGQEVPSSILPALRSVFQEEKSTEQASLLLQRWDSRSALVPLRVSRSDFERRRCALMLSDGEMSYLALQYLHALYPNAREAFEEGSIRRQWLRALGLRPNTLRWKNLTAWLARHAACTDHVVDEKQLLDCLASMYVAHDLGSCSAYGINMPGHLVLRLTPHAIGVKALPQSIKQYLHALREARADAYLDSEEQPRSATAFPLLGTREPERPQNLSTFFLGSHTVESLGEAKLDLLQRCVEFIGHISLGELLPERERLDQYSLFGHAYKVCANVTNWETLSRRLRSASHSTADGQLRSLLSEASQSISLFSVTEGVGAMIALEGHLSRPPSHKLANDYIDSVEEAHWEQGNLGNAIDSYGKLVFFLASVIKARHSNVSECDVVCKIGQSGQPATTVDISRDRCYELPATVPPFSFKGRVHLMLASVLLELLHNAANHRSGGQIIISLTGPVKNPNQPFRVTIVNDGDPKQPDGESEIPLDTYGFANLLDLVGKKPRLSYQNGKVVVDVDLKPWSLVRRIRTHCATSKEHAHA